MTSSVLFCLFYEDYREVEWLMPLLDHYYRRKVNIKVMLPIGPNSVRQKLMMEWLSKYCDDFFFPCDLMYERKTYMSKLCFSAEYPVSPLNLFYKCLLYPANKAALYTKFVCMQHKIAQRTMKAMFKDVDIIYFPEGLLSPKFTRNSFPGFIVSFANIFNKPLVGYVMSIIRSTESILQNNKGLDLLMVTTKKNEDAYEAFKGTVLSCGAQRFKRSWMQELSSYFSSAKHGEKLLERAKNKPMALILLKNITDLTKNIMSEEDVQKVRTFLFARLIERGYFLVIKPHPGESPNRRTESLNTMQKQDYCVSELPASYLASMCHCGVLEMPSNSVVDVIASGVRAYWPIEIYETTLENSSELIRHIMKLESLADFFRLIEKKLPMPFFEKEPSRQVQNDFLEISNVNTDIDVVIEECEKQVLKNGI